MSMTIQEALILLRGGFTKGSRVRAAIRKEAAEQLRALAEEIMVREEKRRDPPEIIDIQVYGDGIPGWSWVKYVWRNRDPQKFKMRSEEAGAIKAAWEAGQRVGAQKAQQPRDEDEI